ncbi:hypothetical protein KCU68_g118, partial [Aureobasidium melanogenum]
MVSSFVSSFVSSAAFSGGLLVLNAANGEEDLILRACRKQTFVRTRAVMAGRKRGLMLSRRLVLMFAQTRAANPVTAGVEGVAGVGGTACVCVEATDTIHQVQRRPSLFRTMSAGRGPDDSMSSPGMGCMTLSVEERSRSIPTADVSDMPSRMLIGNVARAESLSMLVGGNFRSLDTRKCEGKRFESRAGMHGSPERVCEVKAPVAFSLRTK